MANGGGHKWNAVELDGQWYQCDLTFDDPTTGWDDSLRHNFFNITTQEMTNERHYPDEGWPVPECTATKYSYANYFGED